MAMNRVNCYSRGRGIGMQAFRKPKFRELCLLCFHFDLAVMLLHDGVVTDRQAQRRALPRWFGREKWIENFLANVKRNPVAAARPQLVAVSNWSATLQPSLLAPGVGRRDATVQPWRIIPTNN